MTGREETDMRERKNEKNQIGQRLSRGCFRVLYAIVKAVYPEIKVEGAENLGDGPCLVVGNHSQIHGPIACELYFPGNHTIWCASQMMNLKEVPAYAYEDFWSRKPAWTRPFYKLVSYLIAPLAVCIFNNAHTIPVYHDMRVLSTFRATLEALARDARVVVFPECYTPYNPIVNRFQDHFVDVALMYYRRTGQCLRFVPLYVAPRLHTLYLGKPVVFDPGADLKTERERICQYLMDAITEIAVRLPTHRVVPYANVSAREHPINHFEVDHHEQKTRR